MKSTGSMVLLPDFTRDVFCLFGLPLDAVSMDEAESRIRTAAEQRLPCFLSTPNLNFLIACQRDAAFRDSVINSDLSTADGIPIVWLSKLLGIPIRERVAGSTLFERLRQRLGKKLSVYFFGGPDGAAETACSNLNRDNSGLSCAGFHAPGFGSIEEMSTGEILQKINASGADFLVVALGARKGQAWIEHNRPRLNPPVISHLGAVVNFVAGTVNRAPQWVQRIGFEWAWRIKEEPDLWRRYFDDGLMLISLLLRSALPHAWLMCRQRPGADDIRSAAVEVRNDPAGTVVLLRGAWVHANLSPLRSTFAEIARSGKDLRIDFKQVSYVDPAFLGLLLLLYGVQSRNGRTLSFESLNPAVKRIFGLSGCGFLLP